MSITFLVTAYGKMTVDMADQTISNSEIQKTLRDALANQRKKSLAEVMPLVCETLTTTNNSQTFALAGDVLDRIWVHTSPVMQYWRLEHAIYNIFWPRIGSVESIKRQVHNSAENRIFWDSMSWIRSVHYVKYYNRGLYSYLKEISRLSEKELAKLPRQLTGRAIEIKNRKLMPKETFKNKLHSFTTFDAMIELSYTCNSVEDARILLDAIVKQNGAINESDGAYCIECLLQSNRNKSVRKYVLRRLRSERFFYPEKSFPKFIKAAADGIICDAELEILKSLVKSLSDKHPELKDTLKLARENLAIEKFQTTSIRKSPIVKEVIRQYIHYRG